MENLKVAFSTFSRRPGLKCPCKIHGNIHAEKSIHLRFLEWTTVVHGHTDIHSCIFNGWIIRHGYFMDPSTRKAERSEAQLNLIA